VRLALRLIGYGSDHDFDRHLSLATERRLTANPYFKESWNVCDVLGHVADDRGSKSHEFKTSPAPPGRCCSRWIGGRTSRQVHRRHDLVGAPAQPHEENPQFG